VFTCSVVRRGDDVGVGVIGAVDGRSVGQLRNQLLTVAKEHPRSIHVDLAGACLPEPQGIAVFVEVWRFASEHGIELAVDSPPAAIEQAFDVAPSGALLTLRT
jgi:anti-anti-sigma regulatory factor